MKSTMNKDPHLNFQILVEDEFTYTYFCKILMNSHFDYNLTIIQSIDRPNIRPYKSMSINFFNSRNYICIN